MATTRRVGTDDAPVDADRTGSLPDPLRSAGSRVPRSPEEVARQDRGDRTHPADRTTGRPTDASEERSRPTRGCSCLWRLPAADPSAAQLVRHRVMAALRAGAGVRPPSAAADLDSAELVVAELLNNTIRHTTGPAWLALSWRGLHPLLSVGDQGAGFTRFADVTDGSGELHPRLPGDPLAEHGRGLFLVRQVARDVVVVRRPTGGSVISVTLELTRNRPGTDLAPTLN